jgi:polyisoprenyl-phosphate glycosyltransferase
MTRQKISIVTPTFNEEANVVELCDRIAAVMRDLPYDYEHIVIDNASSDRTVQILRKRTLSDPKLKIIINTRNFGHIRSPFYGMLQASGDAVIIIASDLQDPPELIVELVKQWEAGFKIALLKKTKSRESRALFLVRRAYYKLLDLLAETPIVQNATGSGLYDRLVMRALDDISDPYPYVRGLIGEIGYPIAEVEFTQNRRQRGITSQNWHSLYDIGMLGVIKHSKLPLRAMTIIGFLSGIMSGVIGLFYLMRKLVAWNSFDAGQAPVVIGLFMFIGLIMVFLGLVGEYVLSIHDQVRKLPLVFEKERINFDRE